MKRVLLLLGVLLALPAAALAQDKVAYANLDLIIAKMPESREMAASLDAYQSELKQGLDTKRAYAQQKLIEARNAQEAGIVSEEKLREYEQELLGLEQEINEYAANADKKMLVKRNELMEPLILKLQNTIKQVAETDGYTHVLNIVDGTGTSVVLFGIEERDITARILEVLGIVEEESPASG